MDEILVVPLVGHNMSIRVAWQLLFLMVLDKIAMQGVNKVTRHTRGMCENHDKIRLDDGWKSRTIRVYT